MAMLARSQSRGGAKVRLLAVHSTEGNGTAQALRDADWWTGSSHAINDEFGTLLTPTEGTVPYERAAWTLRSGNNISDNIEQVGWAHWTRAEWLARPKLLDGTARWLADRSRARGIPLVKLSPAEVAAGKAGVIGHVDWTLGMNDGTHTDPGKGYPWDVVLNAAKQYAAGKPGVVSDTGGFLMALTDAEQQEILDRLRGPSKERGYDMLQSIESMTKDVQYRVRGTHPDMDSFQVTQWMIGQLAAQAPNVDPGELAKAIAAATPDAIAAAVIEELRKKPAA